MNTNAITRTLLALALFAGGTASFADPNTAPAKPEDALKGPSVPDRHVPGVDNGLGERGAGGKKEGTARTMPIPQPVFMRMVDEALGEKASENLRLSAEQRTQITKINDEFMTKQRAFMEENRESIRAIVREHPEAMRYLHEQGLGGGLGGREGGPEGQPGKPGEKRERRRPEGAPKDGGEKGRPMDDGMKPAGEPPAPMSEEDRAKLQEKIQQLKANAPKQEDARTAIWGVLRKEQQDAVQVKVDAFKAEAEKRIDERYKEQQKKKFEQNTDKGLGSPDKLTEAQREEVLNSLPAEAREKIKSLPPEIQNRMLGRLSQMPASERAKAIEEFRKRREQGGGKPGAPKKD